MATSSAAQVRVRADRTALAVAVVMALGALPLGLSSPYLAPVLLVPVAVVVWVLRARVEAGPDGLEVCNGLRVHRLRWDEVAGFQVPDRGPVRLLRTEGEPLRLGVVGRRDLPRLLAVGAPSAST